MFRAKFDLGGAGDDEDRVRAAGPEQGDAALARVWPSSSTSAFGRPNLDPSPAASNTPATALRTVPKRMRCPW
jgi:hypothetical protein